MKFEELLKAQGLTTEQIVAITGAMVKEKIYTTNEEKIEERYEKLKLKKETLQEELTEYEGTIETLKKDNEKKNYDMALELELTKANAKKTKAVKSLLDLEKIKQKEDGTFDGLNEQLEELKKSDDYLFNTGKVKTDYTPSGGSGGGVTGDLATLMRNKDFNLTEYLTKLK